MAIELLLGMIFAALAIAVIVLAALKVVPLSMKIAQIPSTVFAGAAVMLLFAYYF